MELNIAQTNGFRFESKENQRNTAKQILAKQNVSGDAMQRIMEKTIFDSNESRIYSNAQLSILKAASQISINGTLKETLKYLKKRPVKRSAKEPVLGELWNLFLQEKQDHVDIFEPELDYSTENIFAA